MKALVAKTLSYTQKIQSLIYQTFFLEIHICVSILGLLFGIGINLRKHILAVGPKKSPS